MPDDVMEFNVLDTTGHTKTTFDPKNEEEVEVAREQFGSLIDRGFTAFYVDKRGEQTERMKKFDPKAGAIIFVPKIAAG